MQTAASHVEGICNCSGRYWQDHSAAAGQADGLPRRSARRRPGALRSPLRPAPPAALAGGAHRQQGAAFGRAGAGTGARFPAGAKVLTLSSPAVADTLLETAEQQQVSQLLLGKPHKAPGVARWCNTCSSRRKDSRSRWWIPRSASPAWLAAAPPQGHSPEPAGGGHHGDHLYRRLGPLPLAAARLPAHAVRAGVLATALTTSLMPAILAAVLGFVGHNLLFTAPYFFERGQPQRSAHPVRAADRRHHGRAARLPSAPTADRPARDPATGQCPAVAEPGAGHRQQPGRGAQTGSQAISLALGQPVFALDQHYQHRAGSTQHKPGQTDKAAIDWCLAQKQSAGAHTATLNAVRPSTTTSAMNWCWG